MPPAVVGGSFRHPAGFVFTDGSAIYRHVDEGYRDDYDLLISSGLYDALVAKGLLVRHEEVDATSPRDGAYKVLKAELVDFISYPYEWSFGQLRDAALATLEIQKEALDHGMSLHDASAFNMQFHRGRWTLIDTLSFERLVEGRPWFAYQQFCRHFLIPLALMSYVDPEYGSLSRIHIDGIPLGLASRTLPRRTRFVPGLQAHIHTPARMERRFDRSRSAPTAGGKTFSMRAFRGVIWSLERAVRRMRWEPPSTPWAGYYDEASHYSDSAMSAKRSLVAEMLGAAGGRTAWDLGGNIGVFSREASGLGMSVICFDVDRGCVERNYRKVIADGETRIVPLVCDLRNPSPALGWASSERASLVERGPADVGLALALVHHLAIGNNVPLEMIASFFAEICRALIIEFVPKEDPMVERLLAVRNDIFDAYTQDGFQAAFGDHFAIERREALPGSGRALYLMRAA